MTPLKDHEVAHTVNVLAEIARDYAGTQQLRERIAQALVPILKGEGYPRSVLNAYMPPPKAAGADYTPRVIVLHPGPGMRPELWLTYIDEDGTYKPLGDTGPARFPDDWMAAYTAGCVLAR